MLNVGIYLGSGLVCDEDGDAFFGSDALGKQLGHQVLAPRPPSRGRKALMPTFLLDRGSARIWSALNTL